MADAKQGINWTTLWKKDDWMSVWIGFLILILFLAGAALKLPGWKWMTDGAFQSKVPGYASKADALSKDAEAKEEEGLKTEALAVKTALDAKDRRAIGEASGKLEKQLGWRRDFSDLRTIVEHAWKFAERRHGIETSDAVLPPSA